MCGATDEQQYVEQSARSGSTAGSRLSRLHRCRLDSGPRPDVFSRSHRLLHVRLNSSTDTVDRGDGVVRRRRGTDGARDGDTQPTPPVRESGGPDGGALGYVQLRGRVHRLIPRAVLG